MSSNDRDNTRAAVLTNLCVSVTDVDRAKTTHTHKEKPSKLPERIGKHDIVINMPKDN